MYAMALDRLGQPISDIVDGDRWREVLYPGLSLLIDDAGEIVHIEVTQSLWQLPSGVGVGSLESRVREVYGCSKSITTVDGITISHILPIVGTEDLSDEMVWFKIINGIVVKVVLHFAHSRI